MWNNSTRPVRLVAVLALATVLVACGATPPAAISVPEVQVAKVIERRVADWAEFTGRTAAVENVEIRPRVAGYVEAVEFTQGKLVKRGDLLVRIDPRPFQAAANRATGELRRATAAADLARKDLERAEKLRSTGAVSQEILDTRRSALAQADANIAIARAAFETAQLDLGFTRVTSPIDGRVGRVEITRGNLVAGGPDGGTLLTTVVSLDPIYLDFEGDEATYLRYGAMVRNGERRSPRDVTDPVEVGLANEEGYPHAGVLTFVDNQINPQTGTVRARAVLDNKNGFFTPGMFGRVRVRLREAQDAVLIDDRAIGTDQNRKYVLVVGDGNVLSYREVSPGGLVDGLRVIKSGLGTGETIVVSGLQRVRAGAVVKPAHIAMGGEGSTAPALVASATN